MRRWPAYRCRIRPPATVRQQEAEMAPDAQAMLHTAKGPRMPMDLLNHCAMRSSVRRVAGEAAAGAGFTAAGAAFAVGAALVPENPHALHDAFAPSFKMSLISFWYASMYFAVALAHSRQVDAHIQRNPPRVGHQHDDPVCQVHGLGHLCVMNMQVILFCSHTRSSSVCSICRVCSSSAANGSSISRNCGRLASTRQAHTLFHAA